MHESPNPPVEAGSAQIPAEVALSLISHPNVGKTALARTLLGRDVGEVRDEAHVTSSAERYTMIESARGDVLSLWDTERGINLSEVVLPFGTDEASIEVLRAGEAYFLRVKGEDEQQALYRIAQGKGEKN